MKCYVLVHSEAISGEHSWYFSTESGGIVALLPIPAQFCCRRPSSSAAAGFEYC